MMVISGGSSVLAVSWIAFVGKTPKNYSKTDLIWNLKLESDLSDLWMYSLSLDVMNVGFHASLRGDSTSSIQYVHACVSHKASGLVVIINPGRANPHPPSGASWAGPSALLLLLNYNYNISACLLICIFWQFQFGDRLVFIKIAGFSTTSPPQSIWPVINC